MRVSRLSAAVVVVAMLWLMALSVWALRWHHTTGVVTLAGHRTDVLVRTNRFDDRVEYLTPEGWKPLREMAAPTKAPWEEPYPISTPAPSATP